MNKVKLQKIETVDTKKSLAEVGQDIKYGIIGWNRVGNFQSRNIPSDVVNIILERMQRAMLYSMLFVYREDNGKVMLDIVWEPNQKRFVPYEEFNSKTVDQLMEEARQMNGTSTDYRGGKETKRSGNKTR